MLSETYETLHGVITWDVEYVVKIYLFYKSYGVGYLGIEDGLEAHSSRTKLTRKSLKFEHETWTDVS